MTLSGRKSLSKPDLVTAKIMPFMYSKDSLFNVSCLMSLCHKWRQHLTDIQKVTWS